MGSDYAQIAAAIQAVSCAPDWHLTFDVQRPSRSTGRRKLDELPAERVVVVNVVNAN
jgi:hypothetical protein